MVSCQAQPPSLTFGKIWPRYWKPSQFYGVTGLRLRGEERDWRCVGTAPMLAKEAMLLASLMGDPQLIVRSHFSLNVTPFVVQKLHASFCYVPVPGQKIMCKLTHVTFFYRESARHDSCLWEEPPFAKSDRRWEFWMPFWFSYLNLNTH